MASDWSEGDMTKVKSCVSARKAGARRELIALRDVGRFAKGLPAERAAAAQRLPNLFEAVTASVYLDGGLNPRARFPTHPRARNESLRRNRRRSQPKSSCSKKTYCPENLAGVTRTTPSWCQGPDTQDFRSLLPRGQAHLPGRHRQEQEGSRAGRRPRAAGILNSNRAESLQKQRTLAAVKPQFKSLFKRLLKKAP